MHLELVTTQNGSEWQVLVGRTVIATLNLAPNTLPDLVRLEARAVLADLVKHAPVNGRPT